MLPWRADERGAGDAEELLDAPLHAWARARPGAAPGLPVGALAVLTRALVEGGRARATLRADYAYGAAGAPPRVPPGVWVELDLALEV